jgi:rod shape-determining protein MreC
MAILANRVKTGSNLLGLIEFILSLFKRFLALILLAFCCFVLYFSSPKIISNYALEFSGRVLHIGSLIYREFVTKAILISDSLDYFSDLRTENLRLKLQISGLQKAIEVTKRLENENESLRKILRVTGEMEYDYITAKILGLSINPFANTAIVKAGTVDGVEIDDIVMGTKGVIGRIINVGDNYSSVMLITDHNSRIPVITESSKEKGILAKHDDKLKIIYLPENHQASLEEAIYTSGDGRIYPAGLPIGKIDRLVNGELIVQTAVDFNDLDFVTVQMKKNFSKTQ